MSDTAARIQCYIEIEYDMGRVVFELWNDRVPKTVENFRCLCTGEKGVSASGHRLSYTGTLFHRIISGFIIQGGDITNGSGGESIYGGRFADEDLSCKINRAGILAMANVGSDKNGSQFFVTYVSAPHLTGKHVVIGEVVNGMEVLKLLENIPVDSAKRPTKDVKILLSGQLSPAQYIDKNESQINPLNQKQLAPRMDLKGRIIKGRGTLSKGSMCKLETNDKFKTRSYHQSPSVPHGSRERRGSKWRDRARYESSPQRYDRDDFSYSRRHARKRSASTDSNDSASSPSVYRSEFKEKKKVSYKMQPSPNVTAVNGTNTKFERPIISYKIDDISLENNDNRD